MPKKLIVPPDIGKIKAINLTSGLIAKSRKEELAHDHPGHMHEYIFHQTLPQFHWDIFNGFIEGYLDPFEKFNPYLLLAPRNHGKTTIAESYILWRIGNNVEIKIQIITGKEDLAFERIDKIGKTMEFNEAYINLFGALSTNGIEGFKWNAQKRDALRPLTGGGERGATLSGFSIDGQGEGTRADLQFYDDIVTLANSQTEETRNSIKTKYNMSFKPILNVHGQEIFAGTRFHYADFYGDLIEICDRDEKLYVDLWASNPHGIRRQIEEFETRDFDAAEPVTIEG